MSDAAKNRTVVTRWSIEWRFAGAKTLARSLARHLGGNPLRRYWSFVVLVSIASIALRFPGVKGTLLADDWDHYAMSEHVYPVELPAWDLFRFVGDSVVERTALLDSGRLPWWSAPNLHLAVFRPVSSLLVHADYAWLGGSHHPEWLHLHSMAWWLVLLAAVAQLYRRLLPLPVAALALAIYAADDAHVYPVVWIANRSELVSVGLVSWALCAHLAANTAQRPARLRAIALLLVALALLAGEHAVAPLCYLFSFELLSESTSWSTRWQRIAPYFAITAGYVFWRASLGYGVAGSGFYVDPIAEPVRYFDATLTRLPLLAGDLVFGIAAEWWYWGLPWQLDGLTEAGLVPAQWIVPEELARLQVGIGAAALICCLGVGTYYLRFGNRGQRTYSALLLGAVVSFVPLAGTASMTRLTVAPAIAFDAVVAYVLWSLFNEVTKRSQPLRRLTSAVLTIAIVAIHGARAMWFSYHGATYLTNSSHLEYGWTTSADFGNADVTKRHVFIVSARDQTTQYLMPFVLYAAGLPVPLTTHLLSPAGQNSHVLTRVDANVLDIQYPEPIKDKAFVPMVYREAGSDFFPGQRFGNPLFDVEVKSVRGGQPRHLRFTFQDSLDDMSYLFVYPTADGIQELELPALGRSRRLDAPSWPQ